MMMRKNNDSENAKKEKMQKDIGEAFPLLGYFMNHFFQTIGIAIPLLGGLGYAVGKSFFEGWDGAAGLQSTLFPVDAYGLILQGLKLQTPWYWALGTFCILIVIIKLMAVFDTYYERRKLHLRRKEAVELAKHEWPRGSHHANWKLLRAHGYEIQKEISNKRKVRFSLSYTAPILTMLMLLSAVLASSLIYTLLKAMFLDEAHSAGVREYAGIHALVTGKLPPRLGKASDEKILEFVCAVKGTMWRYRSVEIGDAIGDELKNGNEVKTAYILRGSGNTFLFLSSEGSTIKSYGDNGFELKESELRPISDIQERCPPTKK